MTDEGTRPPTTTADSAKGFVASLLDPSFTEFITTRLVKILYVLTLVVTVIVYLGIAVSIFDSGAEIRTFNSSTGELETIGSDGNTGLGLLWLFVIGPIMIFLYTLLYRVFFELVIVIFRIFEFNREQTELLRRMAPSGGTPARPSSPSPPPDPPGPQRSEEPPVSWGAPTD